MIYKTFTKITVEFYTLIINVYVLHCRLLLYDDSIIQDLNGDAGRCHKSPFEFSIANFQDVCLNCLEIGSV
jgi:hypothetical protein